MHNIGAEGLLEVKEPTAGLLQVLPRLIYPLELKMAFPQSHTGEFRRLAPLLVRGSPTDRCEDASIPSRPRVAASSRAYVHTPPIVSAVSHEYIKAG
jgi:hypothetical protein